MQKNAVMGKSETGTTIQIRRGLEDELPDEAAQGEFLFCLDSHKLFSGMGAGNAPVEITAASGDADSIAGIPVDPTPPGDGQILIFDQSTGEYVPADPIVSGPDAPGVAPTKPPVQIGIVDDTGKVRRVSGTAGGAVNVSVSGAGGGSVAITADELPLPDGAATEAGLGTDGATPPTITGTGIRGWLRAIYEKLLAGLAISGTVDVSGSAVDVSGSAVSVTNFPATQPVSAAALPLPAGAATSALQTTGNTSVASIDTKTPTVGQKAMAASSPVVLASDQSAVPVSAASLPLPSGAATSSLQTTGNTSVASIDTKTPTIGQKAMAASSPVVLASDQSAVPVSAATLPLPTGAATEAGLGTDGASPPAITGTGIRGWLRAIYEKLAATLTVSGSVSVSNFPATQPVSAASLPLPAGAATSSLQTTGNTSVASIDTKTPTVGQKAMAASSPVVLASDQSAVPMVASNETGTVYNGTTALTPKFKAIVASGSGATTIVAAVTSKKIRVLKWDLVANAAVNVKWQSHVTPTDLTGLYYLAQNGGIVSGYCQVGHFETVVGEALDLNLSGAIAVGGVLTYVEV